MYLARVNDVNSSKKDRLTYLEIKIESNQREIKLSLLEHGAGMHTWVQSKGARTEQNCNGNESEREIN